MDHKVINPNISFNLDLLEDDDMQGMTVILDKLKNSILGWFAEVHNRPDKNIHKLFLHTYWTTCISVCLHQIRNIDKPAWNEFADDIVHQLAQQGCMLNALVVIFDTKK